MPHGNPLRLFSLVGLIPVATWPTSTAGNKQILREEEPCGTEI